MPRRELTSHKVNGCNDGLTVTAQDGPGPGGASHEYTIDFRNERAGAECRVLIHFQNGPLKESGINGVTHEALLAIIEDRLLGFQSGPYACDDNAEALGHVRAAQAVLKRRTEARLARGVEGTHKV